MTEHRHQWHDAGSAGHEEQRPAQRCLPHKLATDRAAYFDSVADDNDVIEEGRDLAMVDALDRDLDLVDPLRLGRDRIAPLDAIAVRGGQTQVEVLARTMSAPGGDAERERADSGRLVADRGDGRELPGDGGGHARAPLVAAVALFEPLVAAVVVAERLPEPGLVLRLEPETAQPFRALPEIPSRDDQSGGPAMLGREPSPVVLEGDEGLPIQDVPDGEVRRVSAIRPADRERGAGVEIDLLEQRVDAHAPPAHVELRPLRHAADVDRPLPVREREELVPRPADPLANESLDGERPVVLGRPRSRPRREHGKVGRQVLTGRRPRCGVCLLGALLAPTADEPSRHETLGHWCFSSVVPNPPACADGRSWKGRSFCPRQTASRDAPQFELGWGKAPDYLGEARSCPPSPIPGLLQSSTGSKPNVPTRSFLRV